MFASGSLVIRPNCSSKSFHWIFFGKKSLNSRRHKLSKVNKLLWFDQMTITTPTHGLQRIKGLYFFPSYACSSLFSHLVSKPMIECQIVFKKFSLIFFLQEAQCIHCIFSHAEKKCLEFGHFVQYFSLSTNQHKWLYEPSNTAVVVASLGLSDSFNRITFLLLCSLYWWKYSMSSTVISSGSSYLLWHDLRYAQICQHSFLELISFAKSKIVTVQQAKGAQTLATTSTCCSLL